MNDLYFAIALVGTLSLFGSLLAFHFGRNVSGRSRTIACGAVVASIIAHVLLISDRLWVARIVPVSSVPILGNAMLAALVGVLAGMTWRVIPGQPVRRAILLVPLVVIGLYRVIAPGFARQPTPLSDKWRGDVAMQTSAATCSPAAAATLLRAYGIAASESEMAALCLTSDRGTTGPGLYRGLSRKIAGTQWDVRVFSLDERGLRAQLGPSILMVRLDRDPDVDPRYERLWGWTPGVAHNVVCFGFANGEKLDIGDPSVGREQWLVRDLRVLWHGEGLRLVPK